MGTLYIYRSQNDEPSVSDFINKRPGKVFFFYSQTDGI